jgi:uncharacterized protein involved in outer membrane biogenesis
VREALTVIGFLLILALAALFSAPLYVDWNDWRSTIASRLSEELGTTVAIGGRIEARLLPQPWLSISDVAVGDPGGSTKLSIVTVTGDVSLTALLQGNVELSNLVLASPHLTVEARPDGTVSPLSRRAGRAQAAAIDSFEIQDGSIRYVNAASGQDLRLEGVQLVGEARSLLGPYKAEGGLAFQGVRHTAKISTGALEDGGLKVKATFVPADRPLTIDFDGTFTALEARPLFEGAATIARPALNTRGDKEPPQEPWSAAARLKLTPYAMAAEAVTIQIGPDDRALKLSGVASAVLGGAPRMDAKLTASQLELDRLARVTPDRRLAPMAVLSRIRDAIPAMGSPGVPARIGLTAQAVMLGSNLVENVKADLASSGAGWRIGSLEAGLPGQTRFSLAGDVDPASSDVLTGSFALESRQAATLMQWLEGDDRAAAPNAARNLSFRARIAAGPDSLSFSGLNLSVDDASVEGHLAWTRLARDAPAGRIEADLTARRFDLDALPAVASLLPGGAGSLAEADVKLSAQSIAFAGVEARSASGRIRAGGKLVVLEDVTVDDLGGASLRANGRIDMVGNVSTGEIRIGVDARDLTGLAKALGSSPLPPAMLEAFAARAGALSPASVDVVASFGGSRRLAVNGKLGGTVAELALDLSQADGRGEVEARLRADSLDLARLLTQIGLSPAPVTIPGRASVVAELTGPVAGPRRWSAALTGAGMELSGSGRLTGPLENPAFEGNLEARATDVLTPAQLFGVSVPGAVVGDSADLSSAFRIRGGRIVFERLSGTALGIPVSGDLSFDPGAPTRVEGRLGFREVDGLRLGALLAGSDLTGALAPGSVWSGDAFGPATFDGLVGSVAVTAGEVSLSPRLPGLRGVSATLTLQPGSVSIDDIRSSLASGSLEGSLRMSKSAIETALTGRLSLKNVALSSPEIAGTLDAGVEFQGTGRTPASIAASLTGGGTLALRNPSLPRLSDRAFAATVAAVDQGMAPQIGQVRTLFGDKLAQAPLHVDDFAGTLTFAGGVARLATTASKAGATGLTLSGSLDLATMSAKADAILAPPAPGDDLGGRPPSIPVTVSGKLDNLQRQVDVSSLTAWLTVRAAEREAQKLEALERERLAREKAQEEHRRIEAERIRKAIEAQEKAEREKAEQERAAREKAAREKAALEEAAREKAERERAAREKVEQEKAARELAARAAREQAARERTEREQAAKAAREQAARERAEREQAARDKAAREKAALEEAARDKAERERLAREKAEQDKAAREKAARDKAELERTAREQAARDGASGGGQPQAAPRPGGGGAEGLPGGDAAGAPQPAAEEGIGEGAPRPGLSVLGQDGAAAPQRPAAPVPPVRGGDASAAEAGGPAGAPPEGASPPPAPAPAVVRPRGRQPPASSLF